MTENAVDPYADQPEPEVAPVRAGEDLDWQSVEAYLRNHLPQSLDLDGSFEVLQFPNGNANLTYMIRIGPTELVLRRPPFGDLAPGAHDMKREYKVLSRLWKNYAPAPHAYLFCDDHSIAGADFFIMERLQGEVIRGVIPQSMRVHSNVGNRVGIALVNAVADFHRLNPADADLSDLGKPEGFVQRQVHGWKKRWDLVANEQFDDQMNTIFSGLETSIPESACTSLVHNDLKLDNCMFDPSDPDQVIAIFDWDMTTLGDPLIDLGTLLNYWPDPSDTSPDSIIGHEGMHRMGLPTRKEVVEHYQQRSGFDLSRIGWYEAFANWKTVIVGQQLFNRYQLGDSTDERMQDFGDKLPHYVEHAIKNFNAL